MKPTERIREIFTQLIEEAAKTNGKSVATLEGNIVYNINAILKYLDEEHEKSGTHEHKWISFKGGNTEFCEICHIMKYIGSEEYEKNK